MIGMLGCPPGNQLLKILGLNQQGWRPWTAHRHPLDGRKRQPQSSTSLTTPNENNRQPLESDKLTKQRIDSFHKQPNRTNGEIPKVCQLTAEEITQWEMQWLKSLNKTFLRCPLIAQSTLGKKITDVNEWIQQRKTVPWWGLSCCDRNVTTKKAKTPLINESAEVMIKGESNNLRRDRMRWREKEKKRRENKNNKNIKEVTVIMRTKEQWPSELHPSWFEPDILLSWLPIGLPNNLLILSKPE